MNPIFCIPVGNDPDLVSILKHLLLKYSGNMTSIRDHTSHWPKEENKNNGPHGSPETYSKAISKLE